MVAMGTVLEMVLLSTVLVLVYSYYSPYLGLGLASPGIAGPSMFHIGP